MKERTEGHVIILSEADADQIAGRLSELAELLWDTFARRRVNLRAPSGGRHAKIIPLPRSQPQPAPLDEIF